MKKQTLNMIVKVIYASCLLGVTHSTLANATDANIVSSLIEQANYWHGKAHDERAIEALQKVLIMENNNQDALYLMAFLLRNKEMKNKPAIGVKNWHGLHLKIRVLRD